MSTNVCDACFQPVTAPAPPNCPHCGANLRPSENRISDDAESSLNKALQSIILTTTPTLPSFTVLRVVDIITAECVLGINILRDFLASLSDIAGGRSESTQKALRGARETCLRELRAEAHRLGANAVIGVRLDYSEISGGGKSMLFLVASGTAVIGEPISEQ